MRRLPLVGFVAGLAVYWIEALAWPLQRGRDSWDYWLYYLQLADRHPPFSDVMVFRTPLTPLVTGIPMSIGGAHGLEIAMSLVYGGAIAAWVWAALPFGRLTAALTGLGVLALLPYAAMFHEVSSDFLFGALLALWCGYVVRGALVGLGLTTAALTLARPAGQVLVLASVAAALLGVRSWRGALTRVGIVLAAGLVPLLLWASVNAVRYDDFTVARGGKAWVPFFKVFGLRTIDPANGPASRRLAGMIRDNVLTLPRYRRLHVDLRTYLDSPSNLEAIRLIALSDREFGRASNYGVLYDASVEAIRKHPRAYIDSVRTTFWHFLWFRFALEPVKRAPPAPPGPSVIVVDGKPRPSPDALAPVAQAARFGFVWCPSDAIERCIFRNPAGAFPNPRDQRRYRELTARVRSWNSQLPIRDGVGALASKLDTISWHEPAPFFWLVLAAIDIAWRRPRGWPSLVVIAFGAGLVLLIHALSQQPQAEYAIPFMPAFLLAAVAAATGERSATVSES
jgi:hypothetical protein